MGIVNATVEFLQKHNIVYVDAPFKLTKMHTQASIKATSCNQMIFAFKISCKGSLLLYTLLSKFHYKTQIQIELISAYVDKLGSCLHQDRRPTYFIVYVPHC